MNTPYQPVSCALHSEYELAIIRKTKLELVYLDDKQEQHTLRVYPIDLQTSNGEEFLLTKTTAGEALRIRLDHILNMHTVKESS